MKRLGKVFLGMLCIILLFMFSHASAENICAPNIPLGPIKSEQQVTFKWNETTKYMNKNDIVEEDGKVRYQVYVYKQNEDKEPPNENVDNYKYGNKTKDTFDKKSKLRKIFFIIQHKCHSEPCQG